MRLNDNLTNDECIGKKVTATIGLNKPWVKYSYGNNGEENYYRDVFGTDLFTGLGCIVYMDGESCIISEFDIETNSVVLRNDYEKIKFEIPFEQYKEDFGTCW